MAKYDYTTKYEIGDTVYSIDGGKGKIVDILHQVRGSHIKYNVIFGRAQEDDIWCFAIELSKEKVII